mmetsp:Transcript_22611/g.52719  ORF Transcript_22611/g.52719 Transcript_22611/m.52719 type:complete len:209 (+) Transcript_22611:983-1609(+)
MAKLASTDLGNSICDHTIQKAGRTRSFHAVLCKWPVADATKVKQLLALLLYVAFAVGSTVRAKFIAHLHTRLLRNEKVRALPTMMKAKLATLRLQDSVDGLVLEVSGPSSHCILVGVVHVVVHPISFLHLLTYPRLGGPSTIPGWVCFSELVRWLPCHNPLRQVSAQASAVRNTIRLCTCKPIVGRYVPLSTRPNQMIAISRPARRTI